MCIPHDGSGSNLPTPPRQGSNFPQHPGKVQIPHPPGKHLWVTLRVGLGRMLKIWTDWHITPPQFVWCLNNNKSTLMEEGRMTWHRMWKFFFVVAEMLKATCTPLIQLSFVLKFMYILKVRREICFQILLFNFFTGDKTKGNLYSKRAGCELCISKYSEGTSLSCVT